MAGSDIKQAHFGETAAGNQNVVVGLKPPIISKGLDGVDCPDSGFFIGEAMLIV